jgi:hypothetical protein
MWRFDPVLGPLGRAGGRHPGVDLQYDVYHGGWRRDSVERLMYERHMQLLHFIQVSQLRSHPEPGLQHVWLQLQQHRIHLRMRQPGQWRVCAGQLLR